MDSEADVPFRILALLFKTFSNGEFGDAAETPSAKIDFDGIYLQPKVI